MMGVSRRVNTETQKPNSNRGSTGVNENIFGVRNGYITSMWRWVGVQATSQPILV